MTVRIVRLGSKRGKAEGLRIGTVRRPPRGVPKSQVAERDFYDVWLPLLAPSASLVKRAQTATTDHHWQTFFRSYRREMHGPEASRVLDLLAALSHRASFSLGCYCEDEAHCHRSVLRQLLRERGAKMPKK